MKLLISLMVAATLLVGCQTAGQYDPVKTAHVTATVEALISTPISVMLIKAAQDKPEKAEVQAAYFRGLGAIFCELQRTKKFDPVLLASKIDLVFKDLVKDDIETLLIKNLAVTLYRGFFASRLDAELPEESWLLHVTGVFCTGIARGLVDAGYEAVTPP